MSSHDCRLSGTLTIAAGVTRERLFAAAEPYIDHHELSHNLLGAPVPTANAAEGWTGVPLELAFDFDEGARTLSIHADVRGYGGYTDERREALIDALSPLVEGPQVLEFEDFDSGSSDDAMCPSFFGPTPEDGVRAQLRYAADRFDEWAAHAGLSGIVRSIVEAFPVAGSLPPVGGRATPSGVLRTDLLVTVLHEKDRGLNLDQLVLSDIHLEITQGDSIGLVTQMGQRELARHEVCPELISLGNDGQFFAELETVREEAQAMHDLAPLEVPASSDQISADSAEGHPAPKPVPSTVNQAQAVLLQSYCKGEFAHMLDIADPEDLQRALASCGDGLLRFLMGELSSSEDCNDLATAEGRLAMALKDLEEVLGRMETIRSRGG
jgi:hypothetical protein